MSEIFEGLYLTDSPEIFAGLLSAYDLLLPPGTNQLTWLTMFKAYKVNNHLQTFEKTNMNKKR